MDSADASTVQHPLSRKKGASILELITQQAAVHPDVSASVAQLQSLLVEPAGASQPFLSVILRTRGMRLEPLEDAMLCLTAQTDEDFEVIVVDHNSDAHGAAGVRRAISRQPEWFRQKVTLLEVRGGTRSRPLNEAVAHARGRYVAVYDDDDLLFADWVEQFHVHAEAAAGRLLRSHVATQQVASELWGGGLGGLRTLSWPNAEYARNFDPIDHLLVNHSPFMSIAFPRIVFTRLGLSFDESLAVCEDWDLILRASLLIGVDDVPALTAIYRRWQGASSSYTEHSREQWLESEDRVIERLNESTIILPPGSAKRIRTLVRAYDIGFEEKLRLVTNSRSWKLTRPLRLLTNWLHRAKGTYHHHRNAFIARRRG